MRPDLDPGHLNRPAPIVCLWGTTISWLTLRTLSLRRFILAPRTPSLSIAARSGKEGWEDKQPSCSCFTCSRS